MRTSESIDGEYLSQDGKLCLRVQSSEGDITLGFDGYEWHTHGDVLLATYGGDPESATLRFLDDLLESKLTIAIARV